MRDMKGLVDYLECNSDINPISHDSAHDDLMERIIGNLRSIGIDSETKHVFREVTLSKKGIRIIGIVDIVVIDELDELYVIEAKVLRSVDKKEGKLRNEINAQLRKAYEFFREEYDILADRVGVYQMLGHNSLKSYRIQKNIDDLLKHKN